MQPYSYATNDPINHHDPAGLRSRQCQSMRALQQGGKSRCAKFIDELRKIAQMTKPSRAQEIAYAAVQYRSGNLMPRSMWENDAMAGMAHYYAGVDAMTAIIAMQGGTSPVIALLRQDIRAVPERHPFDASDGWHHNAGRQACNRGSGECNRKPRASIPTSKRHRPSAADQLAYGFREPYWSNTHHFFAMAFYGYMQNRWFGMAINHIWEKWDHDNNPMDILVGDEGANIGADMAWPWSDLTDFQTKVQATMCLSSNDIARLQRQLNH